MDGELGGDLAEADEEAAQPGIGVPVDPPEVVALGIAFEIGELRRGAAATRAMLPGEPFRPRLTGNEREPSQAS